MVTKKLNIDDEVRGGDDYCTASPYFEDSKHIDEVTAYLNVDKIVIIDGYIYNEVIDIMDNWNKVCIKN